MIFKGFKEMSFFTSHMTNISRDALSEALIEEAPYRHYYWR